MKNKKFDKALTIILIIIAIAIFVILGFWGYEYIKKVSIQNGAGQAVNEFEQLLEEAKENNNNSMNDENGNAEDSSENTGQYGGYDEGEYYEDYDSYYDGGISYKYNGFNVVGTIEIPRTGIEYPIYDVATVTSMESAVGVIAGPGPNKVGNTVIMGHNYRNGTMFSDNKYLENDDEIYITDVYGQTIRYRIYNVYTTSTSDFEYAVRKTNGKREITLASCTDDSSSRLIIWAIED